MFGRRVFQAERTAHAQAVRKQAGVLQEQQASVLGMYRMRS